MTKHTVAKTVGIIALLMMASLLWTGCSAELTRSTPKLPPGFLEAQVPAGEISAYLYVSQEEPVALPLKRFGEVARADANPRLANIPETLDVTRLMMAVGPDLDSFGGAIEFESASRGFYGDIQAEMAETVASGQPKVTAWRGDRELFLVHGTGGWADAMKDALKANHRSPFKDAYPAIWDLLRLMPEAPPGKPMAVGFVHVNEQLISSLATQANLDLSGVGQAFGAANVSDIAFIAYADAPLTVPTQIGPSYFKEAGLGAIFVAQSTYPGFVLSFFLGSFADRAGLEKGPTVQGQQVLVKEIEGAHLMVATLGNTFFVTLAPTREKAEALITSALAPHVKG